MELLKGHNWMPWKRRMLAVLRDLGLEKYITKDAKAPDVVIPTDPRGIMFVPIIFRQSWSYKTGSFLICTGAKTLNCITCTSNYTLFVLIASCDLLGFLAHYTFLSIQTRISAC